MSNVDTIEDELRTLAGWLTAPYGEECLLCYVNRMLDDYGCSGLRWATHYRDVRAPRATSLERRLAAKGGYCDCEIFLNGFRLSPGFWVRGADGTPQWPDPMPACRGARPGSTQPCSLWAARRRG